MTPGIRLTVSLQAHDSNLVKIHAALILIQWPNQAKIFAHVTTDQLSKHVQNCDWLGSKESKLERNKFSWDFKYELIYDVKWVSLWLTTWESTCRQQWYSVWMGSMASPCETPHGCYLSSSGEEFLSQSDNMLLFATAISLRMHLVGDMMRITSG